MRKLFTGISLLSSANALVMAYTITYISLLKLLMVKRCREQIFLEQQICLVQGASWTNVTCIIDIVTLLCEAPSDCGIGAAKMWKD